jgi:thioredoxin 1
MAGKTVVVTDSDFDKQVLQSDKLVMVDFWAPWCGPCRAVAPILEDLAGEYEGRIVVAKVNMDENPRYATQYGVMAIPNLIFFKDGQMVDQIVGAGPKPFYKNRLEALLTDNVAAQ